MIAGRGGRGGAVGLLVGSCGMWGAVVGGVVGGKQGWTVTRDARTEGCLLVFVGRLGHAVKKRFVDGRRAFVAEQTCKRGGKQKRLQS